MPAPPPSDRQPTDDAGVPAAATIPAGPAPFRTREQVAEQLRDSAPSILLYGSLRSVFPHTDAATFVMYRDRLIADAGNPGDPIEVMLIETLALAHLNAGRLVCRSVEAEAVDVEVSRKYGAMATAMVGELRRTALALAAYRAACDARKSGGAAEVPAGAGCDGELVSNPETAGGNTTRGEEPKTRGGGAGERAEAARPVGRRPRPSAGRRAG